VFILILVLSLGEEIVADWARRIKIRTLNLNSLSTSRFFPALHASYPSTSSSFPNTYRPCLRLWRETGFPESESKYCNLQGRAY
jgi:hypothetical protein